MKKISILTLLSAAAAMLASCDLNKAPVFDPADSFAAFDETSVFVDENCGKISIPVTIASVDPIQTTVSYELVDVSAKQGVNYTLVDDSAVLVFDGKERTKIIEINIIDLPGQYTKDLVFQIQLVNAKDINLGEAKVCTVKIADLDHPLFDILGNYTITSDTNWDGVVTYSGSIVKDDNDETICWIIGIAQAPFNTSDYAVAGVVSEDHKTITVALGQAFPAPPGYTSYTTALYACDGNYLLGPEDVSAITLTKNDAGDFVSDYAAAFPALKSDGTTAGYFEIMLPPTTFHKK